MAEETLETNDKTRELPKNQPNRMPVRPRVDEEESDASSYLYRKPEQEELPSPKRTFATPKKPKQANQNSMGRKYFMANLRTLVLVVLGMGIMLGIAWIASQQPWNWKIERQKRLVQKIPTGEHVLQNPRPRGVTILGEGAGLPDIDDGQNRKVVVNTDAIRKALFLARQAQEKLQQGNSKVLESDSQNIKDAKRQVKETNYQEAISLYKDALRLAPYLFKVWAEIGTVYLDIKDYPRAQLSLERAVEGDPTQPSVLSKLGLTHLYQNNTAKALEIFETAREIDATYSKTVYYIALCHIQRNDLPKAREALTEYLKFAPNDAQALKEWAYLQAQERNYAGALESIKKALSDAPDDGSLYFEAAALSALLGRVDDALRYLERGEAFTDPSRAYKVYAQNAFNKIRGSELGRIYEKDLVDRTRRLLKEKSER